MQKENHRPIDLYFGGSSREFSWEKPVETFPPFKEPPI